MKVFFTSDWHLDSQLIFEKNKRPFKNVSDMNSKLILMANQKAHVKKIDDTLDKDIIYHVGDFFCKSQDRGFKGSDYSYRYYLNQINADIILLRGNHDDNNRVKTHADCIITNIGSYRGVTVSHYPSNYEESQILNLRNHSIHICGHVHGQDQWKYYYDGYRDILNINVGVDLWNYRIVSEVDLFNFINSTLKNLNVKTYIEQSPNDFLKFRKKKQ